MAKEQDGSTVLQVLDALDHPHSGRILRVKVRDGKAPTVRSLKGATLEATGPEGQKNRVTVLGFSLTGGKVSDDRIKETGRADLHVEEEGGDEPVSLQWTLTGV